MREYLTTADLCNNLSMQRTVFDGVFLVVEGVTDARIYGKFTDKAGARIVIAHSKDNVRNIIKVMDRERGDDSVLGIMDADLDRLTGKSVSPPLFHTDCRDMEMMAIRSNALDDVLSEYADKELLERFEKDFGPVREAVVAASFPIGLFMKLSKDHGFNLSFKDLNFGSFINSRSLAIDPRAMVDAVLDRSRDIPVGRKELLSALNDEARYLKDRWDAARGHDSIEILLIGFKRNFGSFNAKNLKDGELSGALRLAFSDADFVKTDLFRDTDSWARSKGLHLWEIQE